MTNTRGMLWKKKTAILNDLNLKRDNSRQTCFLINPECVICWRLEFWSHLSADSENKFFFSDVQSASKKLNMQSSTGGVSLSALTRLRRKVCKTLLGAVYSSSAGTDALAGGRRPAGSQSHQWQWGFCGSSGGWRRVQRRIRRGCRCGWTVGVMCCSSDVLNHIKTRKISRIRGEINGVFVRWTRSRTDGQTAIWGAVGSWNRSLPLMLSCTHNLKWDVLIFKDNGSINMEETAWKLWFLAVHNTLHSWGEGPWDLWRRIWKKCCEEG